MRDHEHFIGANLADIASDIGTRTAGHAGPGHEAVTAAESGNGRPARGVLANAISTAVVRLFAEYLGRGPTKAHTVVSRDLISVVLEDTLTKAERSLIAGGQEEVVLDMRRALQSAMRAALVDAVESLSERRVIAFLSDQQADPDFAVESFVLEPLAQDGAGDHSAITS
jgi:uncharacterized protein YbcI